MTLKLLALALLAASVVVLLAAPLLFHFGFKDRFQGGLEVLPCTLAYCAWFGLFAVAQNYLWCAERAALSSLPLFVGFLLNIGLNLLWLPTYGLPGAVAATTAANLLALVLTLGFSMRHGMQVDLGTWVFSLAIAALCFGPWVSLAALAAVGLTALFSDRLLTPDEKQELLATIADGLVRIRDLPRRMFAITATSDT